jgi:hypothetical protein
MSFENMLVLVLGKHYYQWASRAIDIVSVRQGLKSFIKQIKKDIDKLDTDLRMKDLCSLYLENLERNSKKAITANDFRELLFDSLKLSATLLGYDSSNYPNVSRPRTIHYEQDLLREFKENYSRKKVKKSYWQEYYNLKSRLHLKRHKLVLDLVKEKYSSAEIANILNMSEYEVHKIKNHKA